MITIIYKLGLIKPNKLSWVNQIRIYVLINKAHYKNGRSYFTFRGKCHNKELRWASKRIT
jgi:hypothetical protein